MKSTVNKYKKHNNFQNKVMMEYQRLYPKDRIWKQSTGYAYTIDSVKTAIKEAIKGNIVGCYKMLRMTFFGFIGAADITGISTSGKRIEIEIKTGLAVQTKDQIAFEKQIKKMNGIYLLVSDQRDVKEQLIHES